MARQPSPTPLPDEAAFVAEMRANFAEQFPLLDEESAPPRPIWGEDRLAKLVREVLQRPGINPAAPGYIILQEALRARQDFCHVAANCPFCLDQTDRYLPELYHEERAAKAKLDEIIHLRRRMVEQVEHAHLHRLLDEETSQKRLNALNHAAAAQKQVYQAILSEVQVMLAAIADETLFYPCADHLPAHEHLTATLQRALTNFLREGN